MSRYNGYSGMARPEGNEEFVTLLRHWRTRQHTEDIAIVATTECIFKMIINSKEMFALDTPCVVREISDFIEAGLENYRYRYIFENNPFPMGIGVLNMPNGGSFVMNVSLSFARVGDNLHMNLMFMRDGENVGDKPIEKCISFSLEVQYPKQFMEFIKRKAKT